MIIDRHNRHNIRRYPLNDLRQPNASVSVAYLLNLVAPRADTRKTASIYASSFCLTDYI